jgi:hypothetical protein
MAVYVDRLRDWGWRLGPSCHLIADSNEELHEFAAKLDMKRNWFQASPSGPHYDLTAKRRAKAVQLGAIELENRPFIELLKAWRVRACVALNACQTEQEREAVHDHLYR